MQTPILETNRLLLRPFSKNDACNVFECWESDPDVAKYMFWTSHNDIEKTREWISLSLLGYHLNQAKILYFVYFYLPVLT